MNEIFKTVLDMEQDDDGFHYEAYNEKTRQYYKNQKSYYPVAYEEFLNLVRVRNIFTRIL